MKYSEKTAKKFVSVYHSSRQGGYLYVESARGQMKVFVDDENSLGAMNDDTVIATILTKRPYMGEAKILEITERSIKEFIGIAGDNNTVMPQKRGLPEFKLDDSGIICKTGDKVICNIIVYPSIGKAPIARVVKNFGDSETLKANYESILDKYDIRRDFPADVLEKAARIRKKVSAQDIEGRLDLRDKLIFTIDGADSKDLDDAVSIEKIKKDETDSDFLTVLGVHIADVSHYVKLGQLIDKEALRRGTSVYPPDAVYPMLPAELSNGICSLNPGEDRLCLSAFIKLNHKTEVVGYEIVRTVIKSAMKCTYPEVSAILKGEQSDEISKKYEPLIPALNQMNELMLRLSNKRDRRGNLDFDVPETKVTLDEEGLPVKVERHDNGVAGKMIEEFMLLANETVARHLNRQEIPTLYRIHERPDASKLESFAVLANRLGYKLRTDKPVSQKTLQSILKKSKETRYSTLISTVMLRSMMKAKYDPVCHGHYGLALEDYCHFTSPIRRYPDLVVHRSLGFCLDGKAEKAPSKLLAVANQCNITELGAMRAERDITDLYKVKYMQKFIGEKFDAVITSVTSFGFYAELENTVEGLVHISTLIDGYYNYDEYSLELTNELTGKTYSIGDKIRVQLVRADISANEIDFIVES